MDCRFPSFSLLPSELRCQIWRSALPSRTVPCRLKMDMGAWNWASEDDWDNQYLLSADGAPVPLPPVCFANRESYGELVPLYPPLLISDEAWDLAQAAYYRDERAPAPAPEDGAPSGRRGRGRIPNVDAERYRHLSPRFNPDQDVVLWAQPKRWLLADSVGCDLLFLAASLAARSIIVPDPDATRLGGLLRKLDIASESRPKPLALNPVI